MTINEIVNEQEIESENESDQMDEDPQQENENPERMIQLQQLHEIKRAIKAGDIEYLESHREIIKRYYDQNVVLSGICGEGCTCPYSESIFQTLCHPPAYRWYDNEISPEFIQEQENFYRSVEYLLREGIVDISKVFDITGPGVSTDSGNKVVLAVMLEDYQGWAFQRRMIQLYLEYTPMETILNFRDRGNCTLLQLFLQSNGYDENESSELHQFICQVRDQLMPSGLSYNHLCSYDSSDWGNLLNVEITQTYFSTLENAINANSLVVIQKCLENGADPNILSTIYKYETYENLLMNKLYHLRYTHSQERIQELAEIVYLLCEKGFNLLYETPDGRNIQDYLIQHGWQGTIVEESFIECAHNQGIELPNPSNIKFTNKFTGNTCRRQRIAERDMNPAQRLLYVNRFEKNAERLNIIYHEWSMIPNIYKESNDNINNMINRYNWYRTPISPSL